VRPTYEIASVLSEHWDHIGASGKFNSWQVRTLHALKICRTSALGGHIDKCSSCGHLQLSYNSCRNRHCPKCQGKERDDWIAAREADLLPVKYFHVVFTQPDKLNGLCLAHPREMYKLLFDTAWSTLRSFSEDKKHLGAKTGMFSILHTWGQNLSLHPHVHCVVPAGGLTKEGKWKHAGGDGKFLFPVKALSQVFRARFVAGLRQLIRVNVWDVDKKFIESLFEKPWVVYAKQPFVGAKQVVEYLGRYSHKIAISNHRLVGINPEQISFTWKDYRHGDKKGVMKLHPHEFIRRFAMHILPKGFVRIRHYGILSSTSKAACISLIRSELGGEPYVPMKPASGGVSMENQPLKLCPCCKKMTMLKLLEFDHRGPPIQLNSCITPKTNIKSKK
jgi:hypothetical protein